MGKSLTPQPPTTSPPNPLSERRGGVQGTVRLGMTKRFPQTIGVSRISLPSPLGEGLGVRLFSPSPFGEGTGEGLVILGVGPLLRIPWILLQLRIIRDIPLWDRQVSVEGLERTVLNLAATTDYGTHGWVGSRCVNSTCDTVQWTIQYCLCDHLTIACPT